MGIKTQRVKMACFVICALRTMGWLFAARICIISYLLGIGTVLFFYTRNLTGDLEKKLNGFCENGERCHRTAYEGSLEFKKTHRG